MKDLIERQAAIDALKNQMSDRNDLYNIPVRRSIVILEQLPSAKLKRDIPMKPMETTDRIWGIPKRQAVCPRCDYYLGDIVFLGDSKSKKISYCETCGQAIDWEGWKFDE